MADEIEKKDDFADDEGAKVQQVNLADIPDVLPLLPVRDVVIYSYMILPLMVGRERSIKAVEAAVAKDRLIFLATQKFATEEDPQPEDIFMVGTVAMIVKMLKLPDGRVKVLDFGETIASGKPQEIQHHPAVLEAYLGRDGALGEEETEKAVPRPGNVA